MHGLTHVHGGADPILIDWEDVGAGTYASVILAEPALVHYWRMGAASGNQPDETGGSDLLPQVTGAAGTYNITGALPTADDDGAFEFNGNATTAGDYFSATTALANFAGSSVFTIECWAWIDTALGSDGAMVGATGSGTVLWALGTAGTLGTPDYRLQLLRGLTGNYSTLGVTPGEWHHIAGTYDGTTARIYVDGSLFFSEANAASITTATTQVTVGLLPTSPNRYFSGKVDEVALYTACLTDAEILSHYEAGIGA